MECKHCGAENGSVKKCCHRCGKVLEGECYNNLTGDFGYRKADGSFTAYPNQKQYEDKFKSTFGL